VVYDAEAIFALRAALAKTYYPRIPNGKPLGSELELAAVADITSVVSEAEGEYFRKRGKQTVVLSEAFSSAPAGGLFSERNGLLFVGSLRDQPSPNSDALVWFCTTVAPLIREELGTEFQISVACMTGEHNYNALKGAGINLLGVVENLVEVYASHRVFIAPHRFAAGIPAKVLEAASHGLPVVASELLCEQLQWKNEKEVFSAKTNNAEAFAAACVTAYRDETLWNTVREGAGTALERDFSPDSFRQAINAILSSPRLPRSERATLD